MTKSTSYFDNGIWHDTYKFRRDNEIKILVKSNGKPCKVIRFDKKSGVIKKPTWN